MATLLSNFPQSFAQHTAGLRFPRSPRRAAASVAAGLPAWTRFGDIDSGRTEDLVASFWTPGLLDYLQEPVTRYHE